MTYRAIDFETTSFPSEDEAAGIMESGWCDLRYDIIHQPKSVLVDCGIPVSIPARAVHHISDEMVAGEINPDAACMMLMDGMKEGDYFVAHNTDFERKFFGGGNIPFVCTYKTSLRIWPDAPGHKLQELRYHLQFDDSEDFDPKLADPAHRAAPDAYVCAHLLRKILKEITIEQAVRWSSGPALLYMCWLKKHKGKPWKVVAEEDPKYLEWIISDNGVSGPDSRDIRATARYYLRKQSSQNQYPT